jgi:hypothetical protein
VGNRDDVPSLLDLAQLETVGKQAHGTSFFAAVSIWCAKVFAYRQRRQPVCKFYQSWNKRIRVFFISHTRK